MSETFDTVIIGGGIAGASVAAELRRQGSTGSVALFTRESEEPYERPPVTKGMLRGEAVSADARILPSAWWAEEDVTLRVRTPVMALDPEARELRLASKQNVGFRNAVIATGAMVRRLQVAGSGLPGIHYLRTPGNAAALRNDLRTDAQIAVVGGSFIACEVAASLHALGHRCTLVMLEQNPLERSLGATVGKRVGQLMHDRGINIVAGAEVAQFEGNERLEAIGTTSGERIPTDLAVVGVGAVPDVALARKAGLAIGPTGGIACDEFLRTSIEGIYAAGDACEYRVDGMDSPIRVEHHEHAAAQGRTVAKNLSGVATAHREVPYFWTDLSDWATLERIGTTELGDAEEIEGDLDAMRFTVRYSQAGHLVAAVSCGDAEGLQRARSELTGGS